MKSLIMLALLLTLPSCGQDASAAGGNSPVAAPTALGDNQGPKGDKGDRGDPGPAGADGKDGRDGKDGKIVNDAMWYDPVSSQYWLLGGVGTYADAKKACVKDWHIPSYNELYMATARGLLALLPKNIPGTQQRYWTTSDTDTPQGFPARKVMVTDSGVLGVNPISMDETNQSSVLCVTNGQ